MTETKKAQSKISRLQEEDSRLVKGKFTCHAPKGGCVNFPYRKYKGEPVKTYLLEDGKNYELPIGIVKHINNCGVEECAHLLDGDGNAIVGMGKKDYRFNFQGLDFV